MKIVLLRLFFLLLFWNFSSALEAKTIQCSLKAEVAMLIDGESGKILFQKNAKKSCSPASITKIATVLFALKVKQVDLTQEIAATQDMIGIISPSAKKKSQYKTPPHWIETGSTHLSIEKGEKVVVKDLLHAILLESANDATNMLAAYLGGGDIEKFMQELNTYLKELGCKETCLLNPHGLHHPKHQTSARDMALIAWHAMKVPLFVEIVKKTSYECQATNKGSSRKLVQHNPLLKKKGKNFYKYATGIKNGYTLDAGPTLVASAKKEGKTLIAVVMCSKKMAECCQDAIKLFESGFAVKN